MLLYCQAGLHLDRSRFALPKQKVRKSWGDMIHVGVFSCWSKPVLRSRLPCFEASRVRNTILGGTAQTRVIEARLV